MMKTRFGKNYVPDWSDKVYVVKDKKEWNHVIGQDDVPVGPQTMYSLVDRHARCLTTSDVLCVMSY